MKEQFDEKASKEKFEEKIEKMKMGQGKNTRLFSDGEYYGIISRLKALNENHNIKKNNKDYHLLRKFKMISTIGKKMMVSKLLRDWSTPQEKELICVMPLTKPCMRQFLKFIISWNMLVVI